MESKVLLILSILLQCFGFIGILTLTILSVLDKVHYSDMNHFFGFLYSNDLECMMIFFVALFIVGIALMLIMGRILGKKENGKV